MTGSTVEGQDEFLPSLSFHVTGASPLGATQLQLVIGGIRVVLSGLSQQRAATIRERHGIFCLPADGEAEMHVRVGYSGRPAFLRARPRSDQPEYYRVDLRWEGTALIATSYEWSGWFDTDRRQGGLSLAEGALTDQKAFDRSLENYLRVLYSHLVVHQGGFLLHSAGLVKDGRAFLFFGPSGAGKTTVSQMSAGAQVLSDDLTMVTRQTGEGGHSYTTCSVPFRGLLAPRPESARNYPLAGMFRLVQDVSDSVVPLRGAVAVGEILASLPFVMERPEMAGEVMTAVAEVAKQVPVFRLHFRKDPAFWAVVEAAVDGFPEARGIEA